MGGDGAATQRLSVADATALILAGATPGPEEMVPLATAHGRVLARAVHAPRDLPPWRNASMDGFAVRAADVAGAAPERPVRLRVIDAIPAGALPQRPIGPGEAARIMTGAPLPEGADSVVRIEDTDRGREIVAIHDARDAGANVRPRGEDLMAGELAAEPGRYIGAALLGVLASVGAHTVAVHRRPRVAVLSTGDELLPLAEHERAVAEHKIIDVNRHTLAALAAEYGAEVVHLGLAPDDPDEIRSRIASAAAFDLLLTSGGVSVGEHDHVRAVLRELGAEILIHRVRIRPGAPLGFGRLGAGRWVGVPGNPVSAMVTFELFVRPLLRRLAGHARLFRATVPARTVEEITTAAPLTHFLRVVLSPGAGGVAEARLTGPQGSGLLTSMARADALLIVPEGTRAVAPGTILRAIPLHHDAFTSEAQVA